MTFPISLALNNLMVSIEHPLLTFLSKALSLLFNSEVIIALSLVIAFIFYKRSRKKEGVFLAATTLVAAAAVKVFKELFRFIRPPNGLVEELSYAFPSGHATVSTAFLVSLAYLLSRNKSSKEKLLFFSLAYVLALLSSFARIYLRVHWLEDIVAGIFLGTIITLLGIFLLRYATKKLK